MKTLMRHARRMSCHARSSPVLVGRGDGISSGDACNATSASRLHLIVRQEFQLTSQFILRHAMTWRCRSGGGGRGSIRIVVVVRTPTTAAATSSRRSVTSSSSSTLLTRHTFACKMTSRLFTTRRRRTRRHYGSSRRGTRRCDSSWEGLLVPTPTLVEGTPARKAGGRDDVEDTPTLDGTAKKSSKADVSAVSPPTPTSGYMFVKKSSTSKSDMVGDATMLLVVVGVDYMLCLGP